MRDNMASLTSPINVVVDSTTKEEATNILKDLGLSMSSAINLFLRQVIKNNGLPFEVKNRNVDQDLLNALKEAEDIINNRIKVQSYDNREDLKKSLLSDE